MSYNRNPDRNRSRRRPKESDDPRDQQQLRRCLRCSNDFLSAHAGNRICGACESHEIWRYDRYAG